MGGQLRTHIAALNAATGAVTSWNPNANDVVRALAVSGSTIYAGGGFARIGGGYQPYVAALATGLNVGVDDGPNLLEAGTLTLGPNPTRAGLQIRYGVVRSGRVRLELLDVMGRVVQTLEDRIHEPGQYAASWDGTGRHGRLTPGLYFVRVITPDQMTVRKFAIIR
jgi:hypothetical protein